MSKETKNQKPTKHFLFLRGKPGVGKITVAKLIEKELGWKIFWFHDLKNAVFGIVQEHRLSRLMDELVAPVLRFMTERGDNVIFVRPSPDKETVQAVAAVVGGSPDYKVHVVRLEASYDTLLGRVSERDDPYRISSKKDLDEYLGIKPVFDFEGEHVVETDGLTPEEVAGRVLAIVKSSQL